ncbi:hypothetical protein NW754_011190 [Fusarium falciforme]|nr:hypothetical protein NW754_011190 [Fusarium falciforme]
MGGNIAQGGAMPATDVQDADPPEDREDGNLYEDLVSSETAVDPRGEPESEVLSEAEAEPQAHHQPGESSSVHSSPTAASGFPNVIQPQQPISLNSGQPGDGESSEDDRDFGPGGGDEYTNYDGGGNYGDDNTSLGGDEDGQSALHRGAGHGRHRDQDHAESANEMPFGTHPSSAVTSFHGLLTPGTTLVGEDITQCGAMPASDHGAPDSSTITIQAEQPARLDAYPPEDGGEGSVISGETEMMAPAPTGGNEGNQDDDDDSGDNGINGADQQPHSLARSNQVTEQNENVNGRNSENMA